MYAIRIRKSDLPLLALLNDGVEPEVGKGVTYLIVDPNGPNDIVSEKTLQSNCELAANSPVLLKLKKPRY